MNRRALEATEKLQEGHISTNTMRSLTKHHQKEVWKHKFAIVSTLAEHTHKHRHIFGIFALWVTSGVTEQALFAPTHASNRTSTHSLHQDQKVEILSSTLRHGSSKISLKDRVKQAVGFQYTSHTAHPFHGTLWAKKNEAMWWGGLLVNRSHPGVTTPACISHTLC